MTTTAANLRISHPCACQPPGGGRESQNRASARVMTRSTCANPVECWECSSVWAGCVHEPSSKLGSAIGSRRPQLEQRDLGPRVETHLREVPDAAADIQAAIAFELERAGRVAPI